METTGFPYDSPSFKHQSMVNSSFHALQMARLGFMNVAVAEYLHKCGKTLSEVMCQNESSCFPSLVALTFKRTDFTREFNKTHKLNELANNELQIYPSYCRSTQLERCQLTRYQSYDGSCNNLKNPDWGVAPRPFKRSLTPDYCDDISKPRCSKDKSELPSAREITIKLHRGNYESDSRFTMMLATWGQFIDHDMTSTVPGKSPINRPVSCCTNEGKNAECFPVKITKEDPYFQDCNSTCMEFVRSAPAATCSIGRRQQMNQMSSFLDGSAVYGNSDQLAKDLRELKGGKLRVLMTPKGRELLPVSTNKHDGCNAEEEMLKERYCFQAGWPRCPDVKNALNHASLGLGDSRANENLYLTSLHVIMARQHNSLARHLSIINDHWDDETIYQEARKIVIAQLQHITFNEFLEPVIGSAAMLNYKLKKYAYDDNVNPTINNQFASASFRFAHTLLPGLMKLKSNDSEVVRLRELLFYPFPLYDEGGLDSALLGAFNSHVGKGDRIFSQEVVHHLFQDRKTRMNRRCGLDLVSLNIQRGRDHGIPGYAKWRNYCSLLPVNSMEDLNGMMDAESVSILRTLYRSVEDIDLYSGALSEIPENGSMLGPTFTCLISEQFSAIKQGDRFWYETTETPQAFTADQLEEIKKTSLAGIICENGDNVTRVSKHAMKSEDLNQWVRCDDIPRINLSAWADQ